MTTVTIPRRIALPFPSGSARRAALIGFVAILATGVLAFAAVSAAVGLTTGAAALPGVSVGGVSLAGLDRAEAADVLARGLPSLSSGQALLSADGEEFAVSYEELGRRHDLDAMVDAAFRVGRDGGFLADAVLRVRSLIHPTALPPLVHAYDPAALRAAAARIASAVTTEPVEALVEREGTETSVQPSHDGRALQAAEVEAAIAAAVTNTDPADVRLSVPVTVTLPNVDTATATAAATAAEAMMADLALAIPGAAEDEAMTLTADEIASWVTFGPKGDEPYVASVDRLALAAAVLALRDEIDRDPVNARIAVAGSGLGGVIAGLDGRELEVQRAVTDLEAALAGRAAGASLPELSLPVVLTEPALTTAAAQEALPQMQLVSSWTTNYVPNDGNGFGANISIGAWDLDGYNIAPGEWFSFWGGIGPVTLERGYKYGGAIINGRSVPNGALAGGICSTSTTLFNAAMRFGLEIGERENHFYYIDRYPTGLDATVAIVNNDVTDMTFRNDTDHPVVIRGYGSPGRVTFQIWSVPNGRQVVLGAPIISNQRAAIETRQLVSSMAPGSARRVEFPHNGFDVSVTRTVYAGDGSVVHQNTWFSDYRPVNGITLVGPALPAPPPDDDEEPPGEEP